MCLNVVSLTSLCAMQLLNNNKKISFNPKKKYSKILCFAKFTHFANRRNGFYAHINTSRTIAFFICFFFLSFFNQLNHKVPYHCFHFTHVVCFFQLIFFSLYSFHFHYVIDPTKKYFRLSIHNL